ncbi:MAG: hypothetical protein HOP30_16740 [Cyclobacteriaceae bacterium]|nr:hypothetical protein [Cyclobacteriaceae bacterium]
MKENDSVATIISRRNAGRFATNWYNHWLAKRKSLAGTHYFVNFIFKHIDQKNETTSK